MKKQPEKSEKTVKKAKHMKHFAQIMIIIGFLFSVSLAYIMGMLYQKSIDVSLFNIHMQKYEAQKKIEIEEAVKAAMPTETPTPTPRNAKPTTKLSPTSKVTPTSTVKMEKIGTNGAIRLTE